MKERRNTVKSDLAGSDYEAEDLGLENFETCSPRSQVLRDFESYNRTNLPLLVESQLRGIVESQIAPIEERVRAMVVDIVRTCQSTVARNFHLTISPTSSANDRMRLSSQESAYQASSSQVIASTGTPEHRLPESAQMAVNDTADSSLDFLRAPLPLNAGNGASLPVPALDWSSVTGQQGESMDSGYGNLSDNCDCSCHGYSNAWNTANGEKPLQSCLGCIADEIVKAALVVNPALLRTQTMWTSTLC